MRVGRASWWLLLAGLMASACGSGTPADVLQLTDLDPRRIESGDRLEVVAQEFPPASDVRRITVSFRGQLARPGRAPCSGPTDVTITDPPPGATIIDATSGRVREPTYAEETDRIVRLEGPQRLAIVVTDALLAQLSRCPGERGDAQMAVAHATVTFGSGAARGDDQGVHVRIEGLTGGQSIGGVLRGASLDLEPPPARRQVLETLARPAAQRLLDFSGIVLATSHPDDGGLRVASVRAGSAADRAGIAPNDVLTRMNGLTIETLADLAPSLDARAATLTVLRGDVVDEHVVSLIGLFPSAPRDLMAATVIALIAITVLLLFLLPRPETFLWVERQLAIARRKRTGAGFSHSIVSAIRGSMSREAGESRAPIALALAPWLLLASIVAVIALVLGAEGLARTRIDLLEASLVAYVLRALARWFGVHRGIARVKDLALFTVPLFVSAIALASALLSVGTLGAASVVAAQGGAPISWTAFRTPASLALLGAFAVFTFDAPRSPESDDGDPRALLAAIADWCGVAILAAVGSVLFLGGWRCPGVAPTSAAGVAVQMAGAALFGLKLVTWVAAVLWFRWWAPAASIARWTTASFPRIGPWLLLAAAVHVATPTLALRVSERALGAVSVATFVVCAVALPFSILRRAGRIRARPARDEAPAVA